MSWKEIILALIGARHLGHGRRVESLFAVIALTFGLAHAVWPALLKQTYVLRELTYTGLGRFIVSMCLVQGLLQLYGVIGNIKDWPGQKIFRIAGAFISMSNSAWLLCQLMLVGAFGSYGTFCAFWFFFYSSAIVGMAIADKPAPGAPGAL